MANGVPVQWLILVSMLCYNFAHTQILLMTMLVSQFLSERRVRAREEDEIQEALVLSSALSDKKNPTVWKKVIFS
jgi:predicted transcriptional regulator YheO